MQDRIMYVAPRYHTNQYEVMEGFRKKNISVMFLAQFENSNELHDNVLYKKIKPNVLTRIYHKILDILLEPSKAESKKIKFFYPDIFFTLRTIRSFDPRFVVFREKSKTNFIIYMICRFLKIKNCIIYEQKPLEYKERNNLKCFIKKMFFPKIVFSPVIYNGISKNNHIIENIKKEGKYNDKWFIPLIVKDNLIKEKKYFKNGYINILDVGKFRDYKNHFFIIDAIKGMKDKSMIKLTIVGQAQNYDEIKYFNTLKEYVKLNNLDSYVNILKNIEYKKMMEVYLENDIFILASKKEKASISVLEAMSYGLCVCASNNNGTTCYLDLYEVGYKFNPFIEKELTEILTYLTENKECIEKIGKKSNRIISEHFIFNNYFEKMNKMIEEEFKD